MHREPRVRLLLTPALGPFRALLDMLRALPWPGPVQRITKRGIERLTARFPELNELLRATPSAERAANRPDVAVGPSTRAKVAPEPTPIAPTPDDAANAALTARLRADLTARDYETRAKAARGLAAHRTPEVVEALIGALRDRSVEVAVAAATSLAIMGDAGARAGLLAVLENAEGYYHPLARAAAVRGLGPLLTGEQRGPLQLALRDLDAEVSIAAIAALSAQASSDGAAALLHVVENADGFYLPITRLAAARALERLPPSAPAELEALRAREPDVLVGEALTRLLERARGTSLHV
ncbi:MAG: HEAT repeat domain-containing protein [Polyangiales bacterium]